MKTIIKYMIFGLTITVLFASCSDTSAPTSPSTDEDNPVDLNNPLDKLPGNDSENILNATFDFSTPSEATQEEVSTIESNGVEHRILRTEIEVAFSNDATVRQINDLLNEYDAKIIDMLEGINIIILHHKDPGDIESLNAIIEQIESEEIVQFVVKSVLVEDPEIIPGSEENPQKIPNHLSDISRIDHQLAIRAHGAWNLRNAIVPRDQRPWFVVADWFGGGTPGNGYNAVFKNSDFSSGDTHSHGYHVLGIALGKYDKKSSLNEDQNDVTGIFPKQLNVRALDIQSISHVTWNRLKRRIITLIRDIRSDNPNAGIILNTSLGGGSETFSNNLLAYNWIVEVRGTLNRENLEDKFILFTAAGNVGKDGNRHPAKYSSIFSLAALEDVSTDLLYPIENLTNTFVVENRVNTTQGENNRPKPGCAHNSSIMGGNLSGVGTDIYSFGNCLQRNAESCIQHGSDSFASNMTGTSMSSPQAAGVAAYVWAINPDLSVSSVMDIIRNTADERSATPTVDEWFNCNSTEPKPVIDAYAAVLAAGGETARRVLLDVNEDGVFDENDIEIYLSEFDERDGALDYSRYDLNGTGKTSGNSTDRFDLNHELTYGTITQNIEDVNVEFDESTLTDQEILCYYAYSDLFEGSSELRKELLNGICLTNKLPTVSTSSVGSITEDSAQSGGDVTDDGGATVTARGVCWSTSQAPSTDNECTLNGNGIGSFNSNLTNLSSDTQYYVRAYATNSEGTAYGNQQNFTTDSGSGNCKAKGYDNGSC